MEILDPRQTQTASPAARQQMGNSMGKILTQAQAEAAYSAMCALNNVGGQMNASFEGGAVSVIEWSEGTVTVTRHRAPAGFPYCDEQQETYLNQTAFAEAYCLQHGDDLAKAQGGAA